MNNTLWAAIVVLALLLALGSWYLWSGRWSKSSHGQHDAARSDADALHKQRRMDSISRKRDR